MKNREVFIMLDKLFNELWHEGYIYETDENGYNMSYGELIAIQDEFEKTLLDEVKSCTDFESAAETLKDMMCCGDDVRIFFYTEPYDDFDYYIEDDGTVELYNVPETLREFFEELKEDYEDKHRVYEDEEDEEFEMEM